MPESLFNKVPDPRMTASGFIISYVSLYLLSKYQ